MRGWIIIPIKAIIISKAKIIKKIIKTLLFNFEFSIASRIMLI